MDDKQNTEPGGTILNLGHIISKSRNAPALADLREKVRSLELICSDPSPGQSCRDSSFTGPCPERAVIIIATAPHCLDHAKETVQRHRKVVASCGKAPGITAK